MTDRADDIMHRHRTRAIVWFTVVVFAYYYKALLCGLLGHELGAEWLCFTWIAGISTNHWIEIVVYCPLLWLALHQVNADVFGDLPADRAAMRDNRRNHLIGEFAIALVIYGTGVHISNVVEIFSRERQGIESGEVYDLVYFLDEGVSHYIQFVPLFFVIGWFIVHDRLGRVGLARFALFLGVGHGVERAVGIIEGGKWFLGPPTVLWLLLACAIRLRRHGGDWAAVRDEFFFRYAAAFCVTLPIAQLAYLGRFGSFAQPSALGDSRLTQVAVGAFVLTVLGSLVLDAAERRLIHPRSVGQLSASQ